MFSRTELLLGKNNLNNKNVIVFGLGGVGGHATEALVRTGIGNITIVDNDTVNESNLNRQIIATRDVIGMKKTDVMETRIKSINPDCKVKKLDIFFLPETNLDLSLYDYVIDAIDTITSKIELAVRANQSNTKIISAMGTGNKLDPTKLIVTDIYKTDTCPLARVMRKELKSRNIKRLKVVCSTEEPIKTNSSTIGSVAYVPSVAGLIIASEVVKDLLNET